VVEVSHAVRTQNPSPGFCGGFRGVLQTRERVACFGIRLHGTGEEGAVRAEAGRVRAYGIKGTTWPNRAMRFEFKPLEMCSIQSAKGLVVRDRKAPLRTAARQTFRGGSNNRCNNSAGMFSDF